MAFENLFIRTRKSLGGIELDAILTENHNSIVSVSKNPIELGADITDHAIIEPKRLNIRAIVSDSPLGSAAFAQIVDTITGLFGTSTSGNLTRSNAAYNALIQLQEAREPIQVQTKLKLYENMLITSINTTQDKDTSRIVSLDISLEEIRIVSTETIQLSADSLREGSAKEQASPAEKKGRQDPIEPSESNQKSILRTAVDWLSGK